MKKTIKVLKLSADTILTMTLGWIWLKYDKKSIRISFVKAFIKKLDLMLNQKGFFIEASLEFELEIFEKNEWFVAEENEFFSVVCSEKRRMLEHLDSSIKEFSPNVCFQKAMGLWKKAFEATRVSSPLF